MTAGLGLVLGACGSASPSGRGTTPKALPTTAGLGTAPPGFSAAPSPSQPAPSSPSTVPDSPSTVTSSGEPGEAVPTPAAPWPTYHHDPGRTGAVDAGPSPRTAHVRWSSPVPAPVQAEPLVVDGLVVVASEADTVLAFSQTTGRLRWRATLGRPLSQASLPCGDINPSGITGTPVADPATGTLWVVAFVRPGHHVLVGLRLADGAVVSRRRVDPPGASPLVEQQRGALSLSKGWVDVPYGGLFGDCGDYHGYVVAAREAGGSTLRSFRVPAQRQAGIWAPSGPAVGTDGDLYVATGNGSPPHGNTVWRLSTGLAPTGSFTPPDTATLDREDLDLGSTGPLLLPGGLVLQVGKAGVAYLLSADHLGGQGGQRYERQVCAAAFGADARAASLVYVPCVDGLVA
ncbi:MAG: PQQ-binding-like beta-propeller repeat protein, partial [Acidimicrobiales bacterium]